MSPPASRKVLHVFDQIAFPPETQIRFRITRFRRPPRLRSGQASLAVDSARISYLVSRISRTGNRKLRTANCRRRPEPPSLKTQHPKLNTPPPLPPQGIQNPRRPPFLSSSVLHVLGRRSHPPKANPDQNHRKAVFRTIARIDGPAADKSVACLAKNSLACVNVHFGICALR